MDLIHIPKYCGISHGIDVIYTNTACGLFSQLYELHINEAQVI